jgi:hypothetical protein
MTDRIFNSVYNSLYVKTCFRKVTGDYERDANNTQLTHYEIDTMILYFEILKDPFYINREEARAIGLANEGEE